MTDTLKCLEQGVGCNGDVDFRHPLSSSGESFARCDRHWEMRLEGQAILAEKDEDV